MEQMYMFILFVLFVLAIFDLIVGVSNDAVNFLNSAIGSKVASFRTIMIVASIGVGVGAIFSNGMMEIAKSGIFNPEKFYFEEVMFIFAAVMLTDIFLLDFFNSMGLPTSTTVSIVFELLGASVATAIMKSVKKNGEGLSEIFEYINNEKALQIISGIFISVLIAFTIGTIVQYISRLIFTFEYEKKMKYLSGLFGGGSLAALGYFLIVKGLKGTSFLTPEKSEWVSNNSLVFLLIFFVFFSILSQILHHFKVNIFKIIILTGTFSLAMAFAGNDMVNFIGVPIAAFDSFVIWIDEAMPDRTLTMESLKDAKQAPQFFLILAGGIMVLTLWFSKKARNVIETGVNLSRQDEGNEKFEANALSRAVVRVAVGFSYMIERIIPQPLAEKIDSRFQKPSEVKVLDKQNEKPAFDLVRASVNLVLSSILISLGTSLKLPLSTTYVTFMVAMGSSLADRAWGRESAVFRVAGVFNVIGGWFLTAGAAFVMSFAVATLLYFGTIYALVGLVLLVILILFRSAAKYKNKQKEKSTKKTRYFERNDLITINEIMKISSQNISRDVKRVADLYVRVIDCLAVENHKELKACKKEFKILETDIEDLKSDIYYFIKSLDDSSVASSKFYILILDYLHNMISSIGLITEMSFTHVNNNHKKLKYHQIRELKNISDKMFEKFQTIQEILNVSMYATSITKLIEEENLIKADISSLIERQIKEIRSTDSSPKNTKLYFSLLLETKVLIRSTINLLSLFKDFKDQYKKLTS